MATARKARFVVGIDLGTTNSAVAFSPTDRRAIEAFAVAQLVAPGEVDERALLPSSLYAPIGGELPPGSTTLPWTAGAEADWIVGELAKRQGARVPARLVASAKSWLCHDRVDRTAPILPWGAAEGVARLSPVEASARILAHVRAAWDARHPDARLADQDVILTVPASFDAAARGLTVQAAKQAGIERLRLIEEPQAAFYDFLRHHEDDLDEALAGTGLVLVVDVGGGTTDLTLVRVTPQPTAVPLLSRVAVGEHLMLGGDNMDVALAHHVEQRLHGSVGQLDATQWSALVQSCRQAKETLLGEAPPAELGVSLVGRGSKLFGGTQTVRLAREDVERLLLDGFLPRVASAEPVQRDRRVALTELGLPYASDPAITRHIAAFLRRHGEAGKGTMARPDAVLLNGGVLSAPAIVARLHEVLASWLRGPVPTLAHDALDLAVARGAASYGLGRRGLGVRIAGGSGRSYFVGVEAPDGARQALCVAPRGMEEGTELDVGERTFELALGRPVRFPLYSSTRDRIDHVGDVVAIDDDLQELPPIATVLRTPGAETSNVTVRLRSSLTEIGTLEIWLTTREGFRRRWRLEFAVRGEAAGSDPSGGGAAVAPIDELPRRFEDARGLVQHCYGKSAKPVEGKEIRHLMRQLEKTIGERDGWSSAVNRELWGVVWSGANKRRRTADHERVFFQLAGFCLRPGFGAPLDDWRVGELWKVFDGGVQYLVEKANWSEWWVLWRRVAGGLDRARQEKLVDAVRPSLRPRDAGWAAPKKSKAQGHDEMVRLVASLERLTPADKVEVGRWLWTRFDAEESGRSLWALGRLGLRAPLYGGVHDVVPTDVAGRWLERILETDWSALDGAAFAATQLARCTGDRERDLPPALREQVGARLADMGASETWQRMVERPTELSAQDEMRVFGDSLPVGLRLVTTLADSE